MKYQTITVNGYWLDSNEPFTGMTVALGEWDGIEDMEDESIFYYLDGEPALGQHGDFIITEITQE